LDHFAWAISTHVDPERAHLAFLKQNRYLFKRHYYLPIPDESDLKFAQRESALVGLQIDADRCLSFMNRVAKPYKHEFLEFPRTPTGVAEYAIVNGTFMAGDGNLYYSIIRHTKPRRIVEIGSGNSSLLAAAAIRKNISEGGAASELVCIEPFPASYLRDGSVKEITLIKKRVQEVDLSYFEDLRAGDVLFIDSTHVLTEGGDVWWEYCEILPRLAPGVLVHVHDISLPLAYSGAYAKNHWYWTEQYLLQAFLAFNSRFEVLWAGCYLMFNRRDAMLEALSPELQFMTDKYPGAFPASFWMIVRD
jgi:predicted O-methyltransferase YrrM